MSYHAKKYDEVTHYKVIKGYLQDGMSHRKIQSDILNIPAPVRGGGFIAMDILHYYGINGDKKGILHEKSLIEEKSTADGMYKLALELIERYE